MKKLLLIFLILPNFMSAQEKRAMTVEDLWAMKRINSFDVSPDGKMIVFAVTSYNINDNKGNSDIYLINSDGTDLHTLKSSDKNESNPQYVPNSKKISYLLDGQIWTCNYDGSGEEKITDVYTKITDYDWSPSGNKILFTSSVYSDCETQDCNKQKDEEKDSSKVKASIFTNLMYRHWDEWREGKVSQLFLFDVKGKSFVDITPKSKYDVPPIALGSLNDFNFSPDEKQISFTMNTSDFISTSTDNDLFVVDLKDVGKNSPTKISASKGNDNQPVYSPDGKYIAYTSMKRAGFEADKQDIILYNRKEETYKSLTDNFHLSAEEFIWSHDSKTIYFTAENEINNSIYKVNIENPDVELLYKENINSHINFHRMAKQFSSLNRDPICRMKYFQSVQMEKILLSKLLS